MPFADPLPHEAIHEVFPDVFAVVGTYRFMPGMTIPRIMTILRHGDELTVVSAVRLSKEGEAQLARLGTVRNVCKIGDFHSYDDAWYVDRYKAKLWAAEGAQVGDLRVSGRLKEGEPLPIPNARLFQFRIPKRPEAALLVESVGLLVTCDSLQYYRQLGGFGFTWASRQMFGLMGFQPGMNIGPGWRKQLEPKDKVGFRPDFDRLIELPFRHLLAGHGAVCRDLAHEEVESLVRQTYPR